MKAFSALKEYNFHPAYRPDSNAKECSFVRNGMPLFRDAHLAEFGSMEMSKTFAE